MRHPLYLADSEMNGPATRSAFTRRDAAHDWIHALVLYRGDRCSLAERGGHDDGGATVQSHAQNAAAAILTLCACFAGLGSALSWLSLPFS